MNPDFSSYSLLQALKERRSRRFCRGMEIPDGPLAYKSRLAPVPLNDREEALMAFAACGITGCALADLPYGESSGGNIMAALIGRTIASGDGLQTVSLISVNDSGAYLYKRPQELQAQSIPELVDLAHKDEFEAIARKTRVQIMSERVHPPAIPLFNVNVNRWAVGAKGTTYYLPVNDLTFMYINGIIEIFNEHTGACILDERAGFRPAGLAKFTRSRGGHLYDDPADGRVATIALLERLVTEFVTTEQGMVLQNLGLMAQALGLCGFPNFANHDFGWFKALNFRLAELPASDYLGMRGLPRLALKVLGKDTPVPYPIGLERDGEVLLHAYTPPYFPNMRAAVEAVVERKFGLKGNFRGGSPTPWKDQQLVSQIPKVSDRAVEATIAYCEYVWDRYRRFPVHMPPFRTVLGFQAGHLDPEFYDRFYPPTALAETQRKDISTLPAS